MYWWVANNNFTRLYTFPVHVRILIIYKCYAKRTQIDLEAGSTGMPVHRDFSFYYSINSIKPWWTTLENKRAMIGRH